jgi:phosphosulfolactate phosphohydrolase-like enzyme
VASRLFQELGVPSSWTSLSRQESVVDLFRKSKNGRRLITLGLEADVIWCARENVFDFVPERTSEGYRILG